MPSTGRYAFLPFIKSGKLVATSYASVKIRSAVERGEIDTNIHILEGKERLDTLAYDIYNDSTLWWVLAAASGIGWALQVPPGTMIFVPTNLSAVYAYVR